MPAATRSPLLRLAVPVIALVVVGLAVLGGYRWGAGDGDGAAPGTTVDAARDPNVLVAQPVDVGFATDMLEHHQQARQMAVLALQRDTSDPVRTLAVEILSSQQQESGVFLQFLADRGVVPPNDPGRTAMAWMGEPVPVAQMPGLASPEQLTALQTAPPETFDQLFLELMERHHEGGVHMAEHARDEAESQQVRELASRIVVAQQREISEIEQLRGG